MYSLNRVLRSRFVRDSMSTKSWLAQHSRIWFAVLKQVAALVAVANTMHAADQQAVRGSGSNKLYPYHDIATPTRTRLVSTGELSWCIPIWRRIRDCT
ncbi:hypothetical protein COCSADRAFT_275247 [Bipolaris sorokiniana ND90Pr]|uniref:Uncharacterized protein n=1 Tax=Cochliobolus sativus (strain ND90Pr / ATCC 201652) TaxID=665912 RepID=M2THF1_COCSN|nr:uncharacterized protein COCSADRAFT_275247 [Bipolaris sorokiniana ND90Pr]EMD68666.1 hypothetical protein COCSADRAFT_275247 [Bipolaris sorokiniana ND90Pr]